MVIDPLADSHDIGLSILPELHIVVDDNAVGYGYVQVFPCLEHPTSDWQKAGGSFQPHSGIALNVHTALAFTQV